MRVTRRWSSWESRIRSKATRRRTKRKDDTAHIYLFTVKVLLFKLLQSNTEQIVASVFEHDFDYGLQLLKHTGI